MILAILIVMLLFVLMLMFLVYFAILVFDFKFIKSIDDITDYVLKSTIIILSIIVVLLTIGIFDSIINSTETYDYGMRCIYGYVF